MSTASVDFKSQLAAVLGLDAKLIEHVIDHRDAKGYIIAFEPFWHGTGEDGRWTHISKRFEVSDHPELLAAWNGSTLKQGN